MVWTCGKQRKVEEKGRNARAPPTFVSNGALHLKIRGPGSGLLPSHSQIDLETKLIEVREFLWGGWVPVILVCHQEPECCQNSLQTVEFTVNTSHISDTCRLVKTPCSAWWRVARDWVSNRSEGTLQFFFRSRK